MFYITSPHRTQVKNTAAACLSLVCLSSRTANPEQSGSFSSRIGQSRVCQNLVKASLISSVKCTKQKSSSVRMGRSQYTAGEEKEWMYFILFFRYVFRGYFAIMTA